MTREANDGGPARTRRRRHTAAGIGLVILGAALGLLGSGLWLHARRKAPNRVASPFTLGADNQSERAASIPDEELIDPSRARH